MSKSCPSPELWKKEPQANASSLKLKSNGTVYILTEETSFSCTKRNQTEWPLKWKFSMRAEQLHTYFYEFMFNWDRPETAVKKIEHNIIAKGWW